MKEQTRPTEQALAGKYQDLNHYFVSQEKIRQHKTIGGDAIKKSTEPTNSFFSVSRT